MTSEIGRLVLRRGIELERRLLGQGWTFSVHCKGFTELLNLSVGKIRVLAVGVLVITSMPQPLVAVPAFICAEAFHRFLPFCMGFAAGCMIWMVLAEVVPDSFKEASPPQVASAATLAVAFMETLSGILDTFEQGYSWENTSGLFISLLFGLGPFLGGLVLVAFASSLKMQHSFLTGIASGIAIILAAWRPLQLCMAGKMGLFYILILLMGGALIFHGISVLASRNITRQRAVGNDIIQPTRSLSPLALKAFLLSGVVALHAFFS